MAPLSTLNVSGRQLKAARSLIGWSQKEFANAAGISLPTVKRLEEGEGAFVVRQTTVQRIESAFKGAGIEFLGKGHRSLGVRLHRVLPKRR